jgi:plastocyanin
VNSLSLRKRHLPFVLAAAAIGALLAGGQAQSQTPATAEIVAEDFAFRTATGGDSAVTIAAGGSVRFFHLAGSFAHNVRFTGAQPAACVQSEGTSGQPIPPLPNPASSGAWAGSCTFAAEGSYSFVCTIHPAMTGSVTVVPAPPPPPPPGAAPPPPPPPPPATERAASALRVAATQRGTVVRGSVRVDRAGSRLLARAFARRGALTGGRSTTPVRVARQVRSSVGPGRVAFSLRLDAAARRALRRSGRLAITLRLTVTPPAGSSYTATRAVILRAR